MEYVQMKLKQQKKKKKKHEKLSSIFISEINLHEFNKKKTTNTCIFISHLWFSSGFFYFSHKQPSDKMV